MKCPAPYYSAFLSALFGPLLAFGETPLEIRFNAPASDNWERQAQPVGNGRIGAMIYARPWAETIQFNDISLWTGNDNPSGGYRADFGAYQNFGNLHIRTQIGEEEELYSERPTCPSGQRPGRREDLGMSFDGNPGTKWSAEYQKRPVVWQVKLSKPISLPGYALTPAKDAPERDPRTWSLEGSEDGKSWTVLDKHERQEPFAERATRQHFPLKDARAFAIYRLVFSAPQDVTHFHIAEIELDGVGFGEKKYGETNYSRTLDLRTAIHTTRWEKDGVKFTREVFASGPDQAIIIRMSTDPATTMVGRVSVAGAHGEKTAYEGTDGHFATALPNNLRKAGRFRMQVDGGQAKASGDHVAWKGTGYTLILAAATDYALDPASKFRSGNDPADTVTKQTAAASQRDFTSLRKDHMAEHSKYMGRVSLDLGEPLEGDIPTRLHNYIRKNAMDPHLEALMFHYGRYLLISCSRGPLPANLQGLWNTSNSPAWCADYHTNINIQMNYWGAEVAAMPEMAEPLMNWLTAMVPGSRAATVKEFGPDTPGWTMRTSVNIFGGNGWKWNIPASAWLSQHVWEHYAFNGDKKFLETTAWPMLVDVSEFWLHKLIEKDGKLLAPQGWSPEHGPVEDGVAHDQQIVWDLFTNTLEAAKVLGKEKDPFTLRVAAARERLLGPQIGKWGQLQEWIVDRDDPKNQHRHTSHLFAVYPGRQISQHATPEFAKAAAVSLAARGVGGDSRRSWVWPWRTALWARLGNKEKAGEMIRRLLIHSTFENLFTSHPPFQIDGNLGIVGGISETLIQSHTGEVVLLPTLPPQWPNGSYRGLRARGGFDADASWKESKLTTATIRSRLGNPLVLRLPGDPNEITVIESGGQRSTLKPTNGTFRFPTKARASYEIVIH